jgi:hypothetical protein
MLNNQMHGLIIILIGLYFVIRFRHNGEVGLKSGKKVARIVSFGKFGKNIIKSDIIISQFIYLILGIIFILFGISKLFLR